MPDSKTDTIIHFLKEKYRPLAILLHGSRAVGKERAHSDWDIFMLFRGTIPKKSHREGIGGEDVEWKAFSIPETGFSILETFDVYLQFAKVLWEENEEGSTLLKQASSVYAEGSHLSEEDIIRKKRFMEHKIFGMQDDMENPAMFLRHLGVFFTHASNLWFEILHNEFCKPFYLSVPEITERDPEYAKYLEILASSNKSNAEKIKAGEQVIRRLFAS